MKAFDYHRPRHIEEAVSILLESGPRAALLAGGSDLLVRLKRSLRSADVVVDLGGLFDLERIEERPEGLFLGAMATPEKIGAHPTARRVFPGLQRAATLVGGCQIRNMATLGGALCSGLRCQYRDQSSFWRRTLGACLMEGGASCHATGGQRCVATVACDLPPALAALGGLVEIRGPEGVRHATVDSLYSGDGVGHLSLEIGELVSGVLLPWPAEDSISTYGKARLRRALDRPLVGVAVVAELSAEHALEGLRVAVCGSGPQVGLVEGLEPFLGSLLDDRVGAAIGRVVSRAFQPTPALRIDASWRRHMAGTLTRRGLAEVVELHAARSRRTVPRIEMEVSGAETRRG